MADSNLPKGWGSQNNNVKPWAKNPNSEISVSDVAEQKGAPKDIPETSSEPDREIFSHSESSEISEKKGAENSAKKEKAPKTIRLTTVILIVVLAIVISFLVVFMFLYFNKDNGKDNTTKQSTVAAVTEKPTETATESSATEDETEEESTDEEETAESTDSPEEDETEFQQYTTRLFSGLTIYKKPDYSSAIYGEVTTTTFYTIVAQEYDEDSNLWGKLLSGVGWVNLTTNADLAMYDTSYYNPDEHNDIKIKNVDGINFLYRKEADKSNDGSFSLTIKDLNIYRLNGNSYMVEIKGKAKTSGHNFKKSLQFTEMGSDYSWLYHGFLIEEFDENDFSLSVRYDVFDTDAEYVYLEVGVH